MSFGILPVSQDEYPLAPEHPATSAIRSLRWWRGRADRGRGPRPDRRRSTGLCRPSRLRKKRSRRSRSAHSRLQRARQHPPSAGEFGDAEEALKDADHVFEDVFFYEGNTHLPIEQHAAVAAVDGEGKLTLWSSTQVPHYVHRQLARVLQMPAAHQGDRLSQRRLRRQDRHLQPRDGGRQSGARARPAGEGVPEPRGSVLPAPRAARC